MHMRIYQKLGWLWMLLLLFVCMVFALGVGAVHIPFSKSLEILLHGFPSASETSAFETILWRVRMPRIGMAMLVGAGLSLVGCAYQGMFRNPMADPFVLGISSGATLGAAMTFVLASRLGSVRLELVPIGALLGAGATTFLVFGLSKAQRRFAGGSLLLIGLAVSFFANALVSFLIALNERTAERIIFWTMGSLNGSSWHTLWIVCPVVSLGFLILLYYSRSLNVLTMGEDTARSLGIDAPRLKKRSMGVCSGMVAVCVAYTGVIGFVGLMVPHIVRHFTGPDHRYLLPCSALGGAFFLLVSDTAARTLASPAELPVGAVTALLGAPYFLYLVLRKKRGL